MANVTVRDETVTGRPIDSWVLPDLPETITVCELIRLRVRVEVARFNARRQEHFRGLVQPLQAETTLNGYRVDRRRRLDWQRQADIACGAFARNGFVMFVGARQVEDLDERIDLSVDNAVVFVKLVALVGG